MRSIVRRDTGESYQEFLTRLAQESGIETPTREELVKLDKTRKNKASNDDWENPHDPDAKVTKMKDGRTHLAHKAEHAVDMESGAILAITLQPADRGDTTSIEETLTAAADAVVELAADEQSAPYISEQAMSEVVADKGYHSNEVMRTLAELELRTYIAEPERGPRKWKGKAAEKEAVYANRRRIRGERGKRLQSQRGERVERNFAHQFDTGGMDRLYVRGLGNVHKKVLIQAAACNLALLLRSLNGPGKPRAAHDRIMEAVFALLRFMSALQGLLSTSSVNPDRQRGRTQRCRKRSLLVRSAVNRLF